MSNTFSAPHNSDVVLTFHASEFGITASKSTTTVTRTAGRIFTKYDVGLTIVWDAPNSTTDTITAYVSPNQVTVSASATIASQTATVTGIPTSMGFRLARGKDGQLIYNVKDLAPSELVARVQSQGFEINPQTLEMVFVKNNWSGPFGAYEERQGQNRPYICENIDHKRPKPLLAPKRYAMGYKSYTADTISFSTSTPGTISDSANGLAEFKTGDVITIVGAGGNNGTFNISTGGVAGTIRTTEATGADAAGSDITITVTNTTVVADVKIFGTDTYVQTADKFVYKVTNWGTPGSSYLVSVLKHAGGGTEVGTGLHVHNGYIYACYGTSGAYYYSTDGTTWTESNRAGTNNVDEQATEMITLRGVLHKRIGQNHYQMSAATDTGINGGTAWSSADQIGDTSYSVGKMQVLSDSLFFVTPNGILTLDGNGNIGEVLPNLSEMAGYISGGDARWGPTKPWLNNCIIVPMRDGSVKIYQNGEAIAATPSAQIERQLRALNPAMTEAIDSSAAIGDFFYGFIGDAQDDVSIIEMEQVGQGQFIWRNLIGPIATSDTTLNRLWATYVTNTGSAGPVLWSSQLAGNYGLVYWIIPVGRDATQDSRSRYNSSGIIYDPWLTFGVPDVYKRWSHINVAVVPSTGANYAKDTYTLDGMDDQGSDRITTNYIGASSALETSITNIGTINFDANTVSRACYFKHTLGNTGSNKELESPILLWMEVHAFGLPTPKHQFSMALQVPVTDGPATQVEKRKFLKAIRTAGLPITYQDRFGTTWTVNTSIEQPTESYGKDEGIRTEEVASLVLVEQPVGV